MNDDGLTASATGSACCRSVYGERDDPEAYFAQLGDEFAERVKEWSMVLAGDELKDEEFMQKFKRLNMARSDTEAHVPRELALLEPRDKALDLSRLHECE
jgi:hypothetical protein